MQQREGAAALSALYLIGKEPKLFWGVAVIAGIALPLLAMTINLSGWILGVVALMRVAGDTGMRYAFLKVGAFESAV
jgi:hypothetical protein